MLTHLLFKADFYQRIGGLSVFKGLIVLDLGCGNGEDTRKISKFAKKVVGLDIYQDQEWSKKTKKNIKFVIGKSEKLPFKNKEFSGLFLKDVLHHVDNMEKTMIEIKRVTSKEAKIILIEGNRYNPMFFIHMTKIRGHEHLSQKKFKELILKYFPNAKFIHFESHFVPFIGEKLFKQIIKFEKFLGRFFFLQPYLSYNVALINLE